MVVEVAKTMAPSSGNHVERLAIAPSSRPTSSVLKPNRAALTHLATSSGSFSGRLAAASSTVERLAGQLRSNTLPNVDVSLSGIDRASAELAMLLEDLRQDPQRLLLGTPDTLPGPGESPRVIP